MPNAFLRGDWHEAANENGWLRGPGVANFVFAAGNSQQLPRPPGRYGTRASDWRPYLPPVSKTIAEIAREAVRKQSLHYREILPDEHLKSELHNARHRKNLTIVVADPSTLPIASYRQISATFDSLTWEGAALLMPWASAEMSWGDPIVQTDVRGAFPVTSQLAKPAFQAPIRTANELEESFDVTLTELRAALIRAAVASAPRTDQPPAQVASLFQQEH